VADVNSGSAERASRYSRSARAVRRTHGRPVRRHSLIARLQSLDPNSAARRRCRTGTCLAVAHSVIGPTKNTARHRIGYGLVVAALTAGTALGCIHRTSSPSASATISGTLHEPDAPSAVARRDVVAVNTVTGRSRRTRTNAGGGYTFLVPPGTYRLNVVLRNGEVLSNWPNPITVEAGSISADADLIIAAHPR